jgi:hypothetical protein
MGDKLSDARAMTRQADEGGGPGWEMPRAKLKNRPLTHAPELNAGRLKERQVGLNRSDFRCNGNF